MCLEKISRETRSRTMAGIKGKGYEARVDGAVPSSIDRDYFAPGFIIPACRADRTSCLRGWVWLHLVHGCFWHGIPCAFYFASQDPDAVLGKIRSR